jgi:hypothetical protein
MRLFRSLRALDSRAFALAAGFASACESDGYKPAQTEPEQPELDGRAVLRGELRERPADFPDDNVRAALAWVDGRPLDAPETSSPDDLRELRFQQNSDVRVDVSFPLSVRVPVDPVEPMHYAWLTSFGVPSGVNELGTFEDDHMVHSIPHAELVLYHDANRNQKLDLLEPGEPGPGPDRVLAVSSGRDAREQAVRSVVIHKKAPFAPPLELFIDEWGELKDRDGLQLVHISVGQELPLVQEALLHTHGITMSNTFDKYWARNMAERDFVYSVEPLEGAEPIALFAVEPSRHSWLARGCVPYPTGYLGYAKAPPPGAAVMCGADRLSYASHPDDYCGQSDVLSRLEWQGDPDLSWWPCDEHGLVNDTPYVAASAPLGTSPLSLRNGKAYIGVAFYEPPSDFRCRADILYDFDDDPQTHLPALPPPPGSQVMCYGHNALSFVPNDPDCKRKFTYDLSSDDIPGYASSDGPEKLTWDLRDQPPEWWPCDKQGKLIASKGYKAPAKLPDAGDCPEAPVVAAPGGLYAPPPHTKIRCTSASSLIVMPLWADHCDGRTETTLEGMRQTTPVETAGWEFPVPSGWPCDKDGKLVPDAGYESL